MLCQIEYISSTIILCAKSNVCYLLFKRMQENVIVIDDETNGYPLYI